MKEDWSPAQERAELIYRNRNRAGFWRGVETIGALMTGTMVQPAIEHITDGTRSGATIAAAGALILTVVADRLAAQRAAHADNLELSTFTHPLPPNSNQAGQ